MPYELDDDGRIRHRGTTPRRDPEPDLDPSRRWWQKLGEHYRCPTCHRPPRQVTLRLRERSVIVCDAGHEWSPEDALETPRSTVTLAVTRTDGSEASYEIPRRVIGRP